MVSTALDPSGYSESPVEQYETHRVVEQHLARSKRPLGVLEIGCGAGASLAELARRFPSSRFVGIDLSASNVAAARATSDMVSWHTVDYLAFECGRYDLLCGESVLQWINCRGDVLAQKLCRDVAAEGLVIVTMPADCRWNRMMICFRRQLLRCRSRLVDRAILWVAQRIYPQWSVAALAQRLPYLYLPVHHLDGPSFTEAMRRVGLVVEERRQLASPSIAKLRHSLVTFRAVGSDGAGRSPLSDACC